MRTISRPGRAGICRCPTASGAPTAGRTTARPRKPCGKLTFGLDAGDPAVLAKLPREADRIEVCGLVSNICVVSNAVTLQSRYPAAQLVVDARLTASFDPALHEKTLDVLAGLQVEVLNR